MALTTTVLHGSPDLDAAVHDVLAGMGSALDVSRAYIFRNRVEDDSLVVDLLHEWVAEGNPPQIHEPGLRGVPYEAGFQRWRGQLSEGRPVHGRIETFPPEEQEFLAAQDMRSLAVPLSAAVQVGDMFWLSGGIGVTPETLAMTTRRTAEETRNIMQQFSELLTDLGLGFENVVKATVYLTDIEDYEQMNEVYGSYFSQDPPARETVVVSELVRGAAIEISFVAVRN